MSDSYIRRRMFGGKFPEFILTYGDISYTQTTSNVCTFTTDEETGNWELKILKTGTGTLVFDNKRFKTEICLVGAGGGGSGNKSGDVYGCPAGDGGDIVRKSTVIKRKKVYSVTVGAGGAGGGKQFTASDGSTGIAASSGRTGGTTRFACTADGISYAADGGAPGSVTGGGGDDGSSSLGKKGADGELAFKGMIDADTMDGQGTLYGAQGGTGGGQGSAGGDGGKTGGGKGGTGAEGYEVENLVGGNASNATKNTGSGGGGGGAGYYVDNLDYVASGKGGNGGSGIIIIRNARS